MSAHPDSLCLDEADIIRLILSFFELSGMCVSEVALERESGVSNERYPDRGLPLREMVQRARWTDAIQHIRSLPLSEDEMKLVLFEITKQKYVELIYIYQELKNELFDDLGNAIAVCFSELSVYSGNSQEYEDLRKLASLTKLEDDPRYKDWNPFSSRKQCFKRIWKILKGSLGNETYMQEQYTPPGRLMFLLVKGLLYESCEEHCKQKSRNKSNSGIQFTFGSLMESPRYATGNFKLDTPLNLGNGDCDTVDCNIQSHFQTTDGISTKYVGNSETESKYDIFSDISDRLDYSLYSWLQTVPWVSLTKDFVYRPLTVEVKKLEKPKNSEGWIEKILEGMNHISEFTTQEVKEKFWNEKISKNLIVDAPEILKRAEEVVNRWETKNRMRKIKNKDYFQEENEKYMKKKCDRGVKLNEEQETRLVKRKSLFTSCDTKICKTRQEVHTEGKKSVLESSHTKNIHKVNQCKSLTRSDKEMQEILQIHHQNRIFESDQLRDKHNAYENLAFKKETFNSTNDDKIFTWRKACENENPGFESDDNGHLNEDLFSCTTDEIEHLKLHVDYSNNASPPNLNRADDHEAKQKDIERTMASDGNSEIFIKAVRGEDVFKEPQTENERPASELTRNEVDNGSQSLASNHEKLIRKPVSADIGRKFSSDSTYENFSERKKQVIGLLQVKEKLRDSLLTILTRKVTEQRDAEDFHNIQSTTKEYRGKESHPNDNKHSESSTPLKSGIDQQEVKEIPPFDIRATVSGSTPGVGEGSDSKPNFVAVTRLEDEQAIRAVEFHPSGKFYAIGSNTKALRICAYPNCKDVRRDHDAREPTVLHKRQKQHKGSVYCIAWNATGDLLATGSNDKTIKLMRFDASNCNLEDAAPPMGFHGGTVRDMCFMEDTSNRSNILISGGAGDNKIYVTDCETATPFQSLTGHTGQILSLYTWGGVMFVSSSQDKTIRFWDMRSRGCVNLIPARPAGGTGPGSAAATISVDPSGRLLVSGHEDSSCMLYDVRGSRILQTFKPHSAEVRTARLSPKAFYLLTGSYDCKLILTDLQGDLTQPLASVRVAEHADKVIQGRWHPQEFSFLSTSADRTATLWAMPPTP